MSITVALCAACTVPIWVTERDREGFRNPVTLPAIGWLVALVLSAVFALDRSASCARLVKGLFPALTALGAWHTSRPANGRRAIGVLFGSSVLAWIYGLVVFVHRGAGFASRARGAVGHYMTFAGQISVVACIACGIALTVQGRARLAAIGVALLGAVALAATYTRSAWLGMVVALAVMLGVWRPRWLAGLAAVALVVFLIAPGAYRSRLDSMFDIHHPNNVERTYMWGAGIRMFRDHPWTGVGLEDLKPVYDRYRPPEARERAGHLHSVPIQIAATMGIVGLVAFAFLYLGLFRCATSGLRGTLAAARDPRPATASGPDRAPGATPAPATTDARWAAGLRLGVLGALAGFLVAGLFEWNFGDEELLYPLYLLAGMAWAARRWSADTR